MPRRERVFEDWRPRLRQSQEARARRWEELLGSRAQDQPAVCYPDPFHIQYALFPNTVGMVGTQLQNYVGTSQGIYVTGNQFISGSGLFDPWQGTQGTSHGIYFNNINNVPLTAIPPSFHKEVSISIELLEDSNDPDALLGSLYDELQQQVEREIRHMTDPVWRGWVAEIIDTSWNGESQHLRATAWATSQSPTDPVWLGWQHHSQGNLYSPPRKTVSEFRREREAQKRHRMIYNTRTKTQCMRIRVAERASERLLRSVLTEEQNRTLTERQGFEAIGSEGGRYWVHMGYAGNVYSLDEQRQRHERLCIHPHSVPDRDAMLAQLLMIQHDEAEFRRVANISAFRAA